MTLPPVDGVAANLNRSCFCITVDREVLASSLEANTGDSEFYNSLVRTRPNLFSNVPVFLPATSIVEMHQVVLAIESAARLPGYRDEVLGWAPEIARIDHGPAGVFMGYDFHLDDQGPRLIEVNTNAGGAFLNALLARAQRACCADVAKGFDPEATDAFDAAVVEMFQCEWRLQGRTDALKRIAIVDDRPEEQYLYPEFVLARQLLMQAGIDAVIADPEELTYSEGNLWFGGKIVQLVYNRLVDFSLELPGHRALREAYEHDAVVVTPNPYNHALHADKRDPTLLSDAAKLQSWGLGAKHLAALAGVPETRVVTPATADALWEARKEYFFKPTGGHGGKAVYRGDKVTRGVWAEIAKGGYVAQAFVEPGLRMIELDGVQVARKMDIRLFTYAGQILLAAARLYQGQTTNFRTPGGGFAPVLMA